MDAIKSKLTYEGRGISLSAASQQLSPISRSNKELALAMAAIMLTLLAPTMFQATGSAALPRAVASLNGFARYPWPSTAFSLTSAISMLVFAKLSDLYGRKRLYLSSVALFACSLPFCAAAGTLPIPIDGMNQFVLGNAFVGIASGAITGLTYTLIGDLFPPRERARYQGLLRVVWALAFITGPSLGGWLTDHRSWRWAYLAAAPVGIIALLIAYFALPDIRPRLSRRAIDWVGIAALCGWIVPLLLALTLVGQAGWSAPSAKILLTASAILLAAFLVVELRVREPLLVLSLFRDRRMSIVSLNLLLVGAGVYSVGVYVPLFIQGALGLSATKSAAILTPFVVSSMVGNLAGGYLLSRSGKYRLFAILGSGLAVVGLFPLSLMNPGTTQLEILRDVIVCGVAFGLLTVTYDVTVQNAAPPEHMGVATGSTQFFYTLGGALGVAVFGAILLRVYHMHVDTLIPPGIPRESVLALDNPLRLLNERLSLEPVFSRIPNGRVALVRLFEGTRASLFSGVHFIFLLSSGIAATSFFMNFFPGVPPSRKQS